MACEITVRRMRAEKENATRFGRKEAHQNILAAYERGDMKTAISIASAQNDMNHITGAGPAIGEAQQAMAYPKNFDNPDQVIKKGIDYLKKYVESLKRQYA